MESYTFKYGEGTVDIPLAGAASVEVLQSPVACAIQDIDAAFLQAVTAEAIDSAPLGELLGPDDEVTIVINDITRFWARQDVITRLLVNYLTGALGIPYENIAVLVALGTHRPQTKEELRTIASSEVYEKVRVVNHDCMAPDLVNIGTTPKGTEVWVNRLAVGRKVILIGSTVHHLMAGFGGGRKSVLPGICGKTTINQNHIHSLDPAAARSNPLIGTGVMADNPVNEDMDAAAALLAPCFGINIVVNSEGRHCGLYAGHWREAFLASCRAVAAASEISIPRQADVVVASCGGFPKDISLYQGVKTLFNAARAVKPGGDIVFLAECREGGGAHEFFGWIESLKRGTLDADLRADFSIAGYIFYACVEAIARCGKVLMLSDIAPEVVADMKLVSRPDVGSLLQGYRFAGKTVYLMPFGGSTVPCP